MKNRLGASARLWATLSDGVLVTDDLLDLRRQGAQAGDDPLAVGDRQVPDPAQGEGEHGEADGHVGQRLGRGDRDLGPGVQVDAAVALPGDGGADDVDQAHDLAALALDLAHGERGVGGLAGLADRDVQGVGLDDGVAVAELGGGLGVGRDAGQLLDHRGAHLADVVGRSAAQDLDPPEAAQLARAEVEAVQPRGAEPVIEPAVQHPLDGGRLLEDLLVHVVLVAVGVGVQRRRGRCWSATCRCPPPRG